jgi:DNA (cytosine-5)-methyltransferase 1
MRYLSVCSGIEAATVAWHPLGWEAVAYSEIEPFPCKVLAHHYSTPNWGDMTKFKEWPDESIDLLVGGTPCQSFSVAGLRQGLEDPRGELMLTYLAIAARYQPRWVVWENVPGVLSSNGGRDFGAFLGALGQLGYGWAYRVLDAQWFGVAQRRRRVFVVGCFGDWERAAKVLFESESVRRDSPSRRGKEKDVAGTLAAGSFCGGASGRPEGAAGNHFVPAVAPCPGESGGHARPGDNIQSVGYLIPVVAGSLDTEFGGGKLTHQSAANGHIVPSFWNGEQITQTLDAVLHKGQTMPEKNRFPAVLVPDKVIPFDTRQITSPANYSNPKAGDPCHPLAAKGHLPAVATAMQVRRLTVTECERLQGFPDAYTNIPGAKDGPRYKALGNSMAVPCMRWIGERIARAEGQE